MRMAALWQFAAWMGSPKLVLAQLLTMLDVPGRHQWERLGAHYESELADRDRELAVKARRIAELEVQAARAWAGTPPPTRALSDHAIATQLAALDDSDAALIEVEHALRALQRALAYCRFKPVAAGWARRSVLRVVRGGVSARR